MWTSTLCGEDIAWCRTPLHFCGPDNEVATTRSCLRTGWGRSYIKRACMAWRLGGSSLSSTGCSVLPGARLMSQQSRGRRPGVLAATTSGQGAALTAQLGSEGSGEGSARSVPCTAAGQKWMWAAPEAAMRRRQRSACTSASAWGLLRCSTGKASTLTPISYWTQVPRPVHATVVRLGKCTHVLHAWWCCCRGCCAQGSSCIYLHRLPTKEDDEYHRKNMAADIFGREKRAEAEGYRKGAGEQTCSNLRHHDNCFIVGLQSRMTPCFPVNMRTGTFERDNRTLFVNYEGAGSYDLPKVRSCSLHARL